LHFETDDVSFSGIDDFLYYSLLLLLLGQMAFADCSWKVLSL